MRPTLIVQIPWFCGNNSTAKIQCKKRSTLIFECVTPNRVGAVLKEAKKTRSCGSAVVGERRARASKSFAEVDARYA